MPIRYWVAYWIAIVPAILVFYVFLTPLWLGIRVAGWLAAKRS